jgi:hypothetical protein
MIPKRYWSQVIDPTVFPDPAMVAQLQFPGKLHSHARSDHGAFPDLRAKPPKKLPSDGRGRQQRRTEEWKPDQKPGDANHERAPDLKVRIPGVVKARKIDVGGQVDS